ncbi:MAG: hypothetical protein COY58_07880 [Gammaproteobacteria bacterium CG_4_10_14_0_8_um_filter_38_16]|nr:MAG: hypothetical protein COY58_07880 [Gammaproteobacteria bacterium CG_4_10_14_0_8_um_filter_38_16]PJA03470.1 MAG: hypothetical protein COX72_05130 [Gammaproteobacteria bacterium CG_4_10_14_0_2_um_filter_38_22]PJB10625.1 MAG: hypothetical protein CO120_04020 [Gammaproteobacteria bacterium CG_4_9_14_3_um_filter_38_9]
MSTLGHFTELDYILIAVILISVIAGFFRGFLREAISLATWFLAFLGALKFAPALSNATKHMMAHDTVRYVICVIVIFLVIWIIGVLINKLAHTLVSTAGLGLFDRVLGFIFGAARGFLFAVIVLLIVSVTAAQNAAWVKRSVLAPYFQPVVTKFAKLIPKDVGKVETWVDKLRAVAQ